MHVNHNLPPVGVNIMIRTKEDSFKKAIRESWITSLDSAFEAKLEDGKIISIRRGEVSWYYC